MKYHQSNDWWPRWYELCSNAQKSEIFGTQNASILLNHWSIDQWFLTCDESELRPEFIKKMKKISKKKLFLSKILLRSIA